VSSVQGHPARAHAAVLSVTGAALGDPSPLPQFEPLRALPVTEVGAGVPEEMKDRIAFGRLASPLPYRVQNGYDRSRVPRELPTIVLDNGLVRAVVVPGLGGRVWSLVDRLRDRELLFDNPVLQYANFALTDAWVAGGIEWNLGSTGHATTTSRPVHAGVVRRDDGDVLRLWEWERTRDLVLQVDLSLPQGSDRLIASTRVVNPDPEDKPLYWWTTIAVPETTGTRVLTEADTAWRTDYAGRLSRVAVPHPDDPAVDVSHAMASGYATDYFYDVRDRTYRHLVSVEPDGTGFAQSSTGELTGRKLFVWGHRPGGNRWQQWLCGPGARYLEIQAGRCPTQLEHDVIPGRGQVAWTEAFGGVDLHPEEAAASYADAAEHARAAVHEAVPAETLDDRHRRWLDEVADAPVDEVLAVGSGWGHAEILLREGDAAVPGAVPFPEVDDDSVPARALLMGDVDTFERTVERLPVPPVSDRWRDRLGSAGEHWWIHYARGVQHQVRGETEPAQAAYERSVAAQPNFGALRGLAVLAAAAGDRDTAATHYARARQLLPGCRPLVTEQLQLLLDAGRAEECLAVIDDLADDVRRHGRTRLQEAQAHAAAGSPERADALLADLVVEDLAEGETVLGDLWRSLHPDTEIPAHLDFRMHDG
jgi:tetratricopeptide (TPR) repeat protein